MRTAIIALALAACGPVTPVGPVAVEGRDPEVPPPVERKPSTDLDARACARLRALACPEGSETACRRTFANARTLESTPTTDGVAACVMGAAGVAEVRRCGGPSTITFDCPGR